MYGLNGKIIVLFVPVSVGLPECMLDFFFLERMHIRASNATVIAAAGTVTTIAIITFVDTLFPARSFMPTFWVSYFLKQRCNSQDTANFRNLFTTPTL